MVQAPMVAHLQAIMDLVPVMITQIMDHWFLVLELRLDQITHIHIHRAQFQAQDPTITHILIQPLQFSFPLLFQEMEARDMVQLEVMQGHPILQVCMDPVMIAHLVHLTVLILHLVVAQVLALVHLPLILCLHHLTVTLPTRTEWFCHL